MAAESAKQQRRKRLMAKAKDKKRKSSPNKFTSGLASKGMY